MQQYENGQYVYGQENVNISILFDVSQCYKKNYFVYGRV